MPLVGDLVRVLREYAELLPVFEDPRIDYIEVQVPLTLDAEAKELLERAGKAGW